MQKYGNDQRTEQIRCILCDKHQSVQQKNKQDGQKNSTKESKFFADDRKDHIILSFRDRLDFLSTVAKTLANRPPEPIAYNP